MYVSLPISQEHTTPTPSGLGSITGPRSIHAVKTLRISVTDRCNFRCVYCMPEDKMDWVPRDTLLSFEEILTVARTAQGFGIGGFKITGGEPLVRHELPALVGKLKALPGGVEVSMTTNGSLLADSARPLREAGLDRLTVSLDTLDAENFRRITRGAILDRVWDGIAAAQAAGFDHLKINCVMMRGINDDETADFAELTRTRPLTIRFIEYMPLGRTALGGDYEQRFIGEAEIRRCITERCGPLLATSKDTGDGPAIVYQLEGAAGKIGFISAMSKPFCETCNRLRLTAEGQLRSCLFDGGEVELRPILRGDAPSRIGTELRDAFVRCVAFKPEVHSYTGNRQMSQIGG